ncbi:MAG: hypothetical protein QXX09_02615 [Candidatus Methanomethylicia archaeon]
MVKLKIALISITSIIVSGRGMFNPLMLILGITILTILLNKFLFHKLAVFEMNLKTHSYS